MESSRRGRGRLSKVIKGSKTKAENKEQQEQQEEMDVDGGKHHVQQATATGAAAASSPPSVSLAVEGGASAAGDGSNLSKKRGRPRLPRQATERYSTRSWFPWEDPVLYGI